MHEYLALELMPVVSAEEIYKKVLLYIPHRAVSKYNEIRLDYNASV